MSARDDDFYAWQWPGLQALDELTGPDAPYDELFELATDDAYADIDDTTDD